MTEGSLLERVRRLDWRVTDQRLAIARVLDGRAVHVTAHEVLEAAQDHHARLSLATVYNTLNELVELGELSAVRPDDGPTRYDTNPARPHQHLVCVDCGALHDVHPDELPGLAEGQRHGFELLAVDVTWRGRCPGCRENG